MGPSTIQIGAATLHHADAVTALSALPAASIDAIVTDPPYELGFMGKSWDRTGIANSVAMWLECLRVLKPGGHLLSFGGARTYHRMACAIEDAGFEIRDQIMWIYGSGFPKSLNVAKAIESGGGRPEDIRRMAMGDDYAPSGRGRSNYDHGAASAMNGAAGTWAPTTDAAREWEGWGTALKPAHEPICVARKPLAEGSVAANVLAHGTGAINIGACRVAPTGESRPRDGEASQDRRYTSNGSTNYAALPGVRGGDPTGRWPANVIHDGSGVVLDAFARFGEDKGQSAALSTRNSDKARNTFGAFAGTADADFSPHDPLGSAARFFYCAKASREDRGEFNTHPTVKPTELMRYLVTLVTPPGGVVLDPFMGSGSTGKAAAIDGFEFIGFDLIAEHVEIARRRIALVHEAAPLLAGGF